MAEFDDKYIDPSKRLECRYYEPQYPEIEELVMVNVRNIAEMGAYVTLLEYNNIEGMILLSELTRRRIRSVNKLIRVGKQLARDRPEVPLLDDRCRMTAAG